MKKLIFILILLLTLATSVSVQGETFTKYTGESAEDIELAKSVYEKGKEVGVRAVEVNGPIMVIYVAEELYRSMFYDRIIGNRLMRTWQQMIAQNYSSGSTVGTVLSYVGGQKVAECTTKGFFGTEVVVKWFDD